MDIASAPGLEQRGAVPGSAASLPGKCLRALDFSTGEAEGVRKARSQSGLHTEFKTARCCLKKQTKSSPKSLRHPAFETQGLPKVASTSELIPSPPKGWGSRYMLCPGPYDSSLTEVLGWRESSVAKGVYRCSRGPAFGSHHSQKVAHGCHMWSQETEHPPLASTGPYTHTYVEKRKGKKKKALMHEKESKWPLHLHSLGGDVPMPPCEGMSWSPGAAPSLRHSAMTQAEPKDKDSKGNEW